MNPKPIQFTSKKTSNYYPNYPIQLPSTMKKVQSNCNLTTIQLASNYHPVICYIAMEATAHRNRWLKRWFIVFEMVIFHSYAQQSTIQLPSNSPVFYGGSRWLGRPCLDKTRQEAPVSTQRDVAKVQRLAKASELAAGTAGMTEGGLQICGNHGIYSTDSTVITWDKPWKWKRAKKKTWTCQNIGKLLFKT